MFASVVKNELQFQKKCFEKNCSHEGIFDRDKEGWKKMTIADDSWCSCGHHKLKHEKNCGKCLVEDCECRKFSVKEGEYNVN
jgi:nitrite reductase/ring-hydroxylating ferredoxin subunit